jgi:hypothetical protein
MRERSIGLLDLEKFPSIAVGHHQIQGDGGRLRAVRHC